PRFRGERGRLPDSSDARWATDGRAEPARRGRARTHGAASAVSLFWYLLRTRGRTRWPSWLALGLAIGLGAGVVLAMAAGARRADTAAQRLSAATERADAYVDSGYFYNRSRIDSGQIGRLPQVKAFGRRDELVADGRTRFGDAIWPDESP